MKQAIADLRTALDVTEPRIREFCADPKHWTAHLSLLGYLGDFLGNARAVLVLTERPETRLALWSNARLAFESAQDALFLLTAEDVDQAGAEIRAFERLELADWKGKMALAYPEATERASYVDLVAKEIEHILWDTARAQEIAPELVAGLRTAIAQRQPHYADPDTYKPSHWYGSRPKIARLIAERIGVADEARREIGLYAHLSRFAHPRYRVDAHERADGAPRFATFIPKAATVRQAVEFTEIATNIMAMALNVLEGKPVAERIPLVAGSEPDVPDLE